MEFEIKCHLGYEVSGPASFLFNVAVAQNSFQRIITEHFDLAGADSRQEMVIGGQRYHRVTAQSGSVVLVYEAVVDATHELFGDPSRLQVPLFEQIPAEALVFIYPEPFLSVRFTCPTCETRVQPRRVWVLPRYADM
jgi:hypothetical protein